MSDAVFPAGLPLTPTLMVDRLERWAKTLRAVEVWREPRADAR